MKKFILKLVCWGLASLLLQLLIFEILFGQYSSPTLSLYFCSNFSWLSIYSRVQSSHKHASYEQLIVGDSVASQLFPYINKKGFSTSDNFLTTNGAVLSAGNYVLCRNAIQNNPNLKSIIYISVPGVIGHKFERSRTCNNFVKPFFEISTLKFLDQATTDKIINHPLNILYLFKLYKCLPFDEFNFYDNLKKDDFELSNCSIKYLKKLHDLCTKKGIELIVLSSPIPKTKYDRFKAIEGRMRKQIAESGLQKPFRFYFDELHSYPDHYFKDGLHFAAKRLSIKHDEQKRIFAIASRASIAAKTTQSQNLLRE